MRAQPLFAEEKAGYAKVPPPCPVFGTCGGCSLQDLAYEDQLRLKRTRLAHAFAALGDVPPIELVPLEDPWRYRNKAELTFAQSRDGSLLLGYHAAGSFWRVVDVDDCLLLPQAVIPCLQDVRALSAGSGLPVYQPRTHQGCFRYLLVRYSQATGQMLLGLITAPDARAKEVVEGIAREIMARHPSVASFYWGVTSKLADIAIPDELIHLGGQPLLEDRIGPFQLQVHPLSFLQPSSVQADRIYTALCESLPERGGVAWDLYCGLGVVGFYLAPHLRRVYAIDVEPQHIALARSNASANGLTNLEFHAGAVETLLLDRRFWLQEAKPDVIVVDPPRAGLHPSALASLLAAKPRQLVYLSCNVQSLLRDLQALLSGFPRYRLADLRAFDMFPQTTHVETFVRLQRV